MIKKKKKKIVTNQRSKKKTKKREQFRVKLDGTMICAITVVRQGEVGNEILTALPCNFYSSLHTPF